MISLQKANIARWLVSLALFTCSLIYAETPRYTIGVTASYQPLSTQADKKSHFFGFEIDLMNEICNQLKIECEYHPLIVSKITAAFIAGKIDLAIAAIVRPSSPPSGFIFSLPYLESYGQFMALKNSRVNTVKDIENKTVGVRLNTLDNGHLFRDLILHMFDNKVKVVEYTTLDDILLELSNDSIDILFDNKVAVQYWYQNNNEMYKLIGNPISIGNGYAIMSTEKNAALIAQINQILTKMTTDGSYKTLYQTYFS